MKLYVKDYKGNEVEIYPVVQTRKDIVEMAGETFKLGKSDYFYHAHEVYAKPIPDLSFWYALIFSAIAYVSILNWIAPIIVYILSYGIGQMYHYFDRKAVKKFNESTIL